METKAFIELSKMLDTLFADICKLFNIECYDGKSENERLKQIEDLAKQTTKRDGIKIVNSILDGWDSIKKRSNPKAKAVLLEVFKGLYKTDLRELNIDNIDSEIGKKIIFACIGKATDVLHYESEIAAAKYLREESKFNINMDQPPKHVNINELDDLILRCMGIGKNNIIAILTEIEANKINGIELNSYITVFNDKLSEYYNETLVKFIKPFYKIDNFDFTDLNYELMSAQMKKPNLLLCVLSFAFHVENFRIKVNEKYKIKEQDIKAKKETPQQIPGNKIPSCRQYALYYHFLWLAEEIEGFKSGEQMKWLKAISIEKNIDFENLKKYWKGANDNKILHKGTTENIKDLEIAITLLSSNNPKSHTLANEAIKKAKENQK